MSENNETNKSQELNPSALHGERSPEMSKPSKPPAISKKNGWLIAGIGLVGTFAGIISVVTLGILDQRSLIPVLAPMTLVFWVIWKIGKTILRMHDQSEYEHRRNREIQDAIQ